jgi:integrase
MERLTPESVARHAPKTQRYEVSDSLKQGLRLIVFPSGEKSYAVRYRFQHKKRKLTIGSTDKFTLAQARTAYDTAMELLAQGIDPGAAKTGKAPADLTVKSAVDLYREKHVDVQMEDGTASYWKRELTDLEQAFPARGLRSIRKGDLLPLLDHAAERGPEARRTTLKVIRCFFIWALGRDMVDSNPTDGIKRGKAEPRERYLLPDELRAVWHACEAVNVYAGAMAKLLILTGARRDEIRGLRWNEIVGDWIVLSEARTKTDVVHRIFITPQIKAILDALPKRGEFVFGVRAPMSNADRIKNAIDDALPERFTIPWAFHDLRRTFSTLAVSECGVDPLVAEKCIGHKLKGVQAIYQRHDFLKQCKAAWEAWGTYVEKLVGENVRKLVA